MEEETLELVKTITQPVGELLTRDPLTTRPDAPLKEAIAVLVKQKVGGLAVVDPDDGRLCGILTSQDVLQAIVDGGLLPG